MYAGDKLSVSNPRPDGVQYLVDVTGPDPETVTLYGWKAVESFLTKQMPAWSGCGIESISPTRPVAREVPTRAAGDPQVYVYAQTYRLTQMRTSMISSEIDKDAVTHVGSTFAAEPPKVSVGAAVEAQPTQTPKP